MATAAAAMLMLAACSGDGGENGDGDTGAADDPIAGDAVEDA